MEFTAIAKKIKGDKFKSSTLKVEIYSIKEDSKKIIGEYERDYHSLHKTFHPFQHKGNYYALYSPHYKETRIMKLPLCDDYCVVEGKFSPVEYYVPSYDDLCDHQKFDKEWNKQFEDVIGSFGFISGCYWGDDNSWKIGYLDLSKLEEKIAKIDFRFGYISQPANMTLAQCIDLSDYSPNDKEYSITISHTNRYEMNKHYLTSEPVLLNQQDDKIPRYNGLNLNNLKKSELIRVILDKKTQE